MGAVDVPRVLLLKQFRNLTGVHRSTMHFLRKSAQKVPKNPLHFLRKSAQKYLKIRELMERL
jgi:hypothetical protein